MRARDEAEVLRVLVEEIRRAAESEASRIVEEAVRKAGSIIEEAKREAESLRARRLEEVRRRVRAEASRKIAAAKMRLRSEYLSAREEVIRSLLDAAIERALRHMSEGSDLYRRGLVNLVVEAATSIDSSRLVVLCNERDRPLLAELAPKIAAEIRARTGRDVSVRVADETIRCMGGVIVCDESGRVYYNNTVEARIESLRRGALTELLRSLGVDV